MSSCINHPEVKTQRSCALCGEAFCSACLELVDPIGPLCADCERTLEYEGSTDILERLPEIRAQVRASIPAPRPWWGWELLFICICLFPTVYSCQTVADRYRDEQIMAILSVEPLLPGVVTRQLTELVTALERYHVEHGDYPSRLEDLELPHEEGSNPFADPYGPRGSTLLYETGVQGFCLCSRGPDRENNQGLAFDRFSKLGDICVESGKI